MKRNRRKNPRPLPTATRGLVADLAYIIRTWEVPPPELLALLDRTLGVVAIAGCKAGPPIEHGRQAVEILVAVRDGDMEPTRAIQALKSLGTPSPKSNEPWLGVTIGEVERAEAAVCGARLPAQ